MSPSWWYPTPAMKIKLPYATVLLNRGGLAPALGGGAPALRRTLFTGFASCAAAGAAAAVTAAAAATPRPRNFRRLVVLIEMFLPFRNRYPRRPPPARYWCRSAVQRASPYSPSATVPGILPPSALPVNWYETRVPSVP